MTPMMTPHVQNLADMRCAVAELQRVYDATRSRLLEEVGAGRYLEGTNIYALQDATGRPILAPMLIEIVRGRAVLATIECDDELRDQFAAGPAEMSGRGNQFGIVTEDPPMSNCPDCGAAPGDPHKGSHAAPGATPMRPADKPPPPPKSSEG